MIAPIMEHSARSRIAAASESRHARPLSSLRPAFCVGGMYTEASGVPRIVSELANAMGRRGVAVPVYTAECGGRKATDHMLTPPASCIAYRGLWLGRLSWSPKLRRRIIADMPQFEVVHNHSLWMLPNHYASEVAARQNKPVIFTAHGTLEPWAIARSGWKKRLAASWFQRRDLEQAACIHVNSVSEIAGVRAWGLKNPVAVIPNGVHVPPPRDAAAAERFVAEYPHLRGRRIVLFLSRLHEKKGLKHLIEGWARVHRDMSDWHLVIVGPDDGYEMQLKQAIATQNLSDSVTLTGPRSGEAKRQALAAAELFVLPSFSEGFSMAVLEALAAELPVLITPGCNFPEVERRGVGRVVAADVDGVEQGLRELLSFDTAELRQMGRRGRAMVENGYTWDQVAGETLELYRWLIDGGPAPVCVEKGRTA